MKKIFLIGLMTIGLLFSYQSKAQQATLLPLVAGDTVSTSSSLDTVSKVLRVTAGYSGLGIQVNAVKVSGTITAKAYLYGSLDGTTYVVTDSSAAYANAAGAQSMFFTKTATLPYTYYQIQVRPPTSAASTEVLAVRIYYVLRKTKTE